MRERGLHEVPFSLFFFIVVHVVGNLHMFKGPDDFNGYGYFYVRLYCIGCWIPGEHRQGICAVECVTTRLRGF